VTPAPTACAVEIVSAQVRRKGFTLTGSRTEMCSQVRDPLPTHKKEAGPDVRTGSHTAGDLRERRDACLALASARVRPIAVAAADRAVLVVDEVLDLAFDRHIATIRLGLGLLGRGVRDARAALDLVRPPVLVRQRGDVTLGLGFRLPQRRETFYTASPVGGGSCGPPSADVRPMLTARSRAGTQHALSPTLPG
jgi:hypothetical protein